MSQERPLEGVRVLDLSRLLPGPYASMVLADLGAQVDKVEDARGGDYLRVTPPQADDGMATAFHIVNRGKRSVVLDLKNPAGRDALLRLVPKYDVVLESFRPGVMERLGLGYETLREAHPGLVYCAISGYGKDGPLQNRAGHDLNYLARAGVLSFTGPEGSPPQVPGVQIADIGGGALFAVIGILAALHERERSGEGRFVDISMCEGALAFTVFGLSQRLGGFDFPRGGDVLMGGIAPYNTYATKDGKAVALGALEPKFWSAFCTGVGIDNDFAAQVPGEHQAEWKAKLAEVFAGKTRDEWAELAAEWDCCLEPVLGAEELAADPQHAARGVFVMRPTGGGGELALPRTPVAPPAEGMAPKQGQHSAAILSDAGFSDDEVAALRDSGATR